MLDELLKESSVTKYLYDEGKAEGLVEGKAEGLVEGKAEGLVEGKAEGIRELAQVALESRFSPLDGDVVAAIASADIAALRDLVSRITTVTIDEVRSRLGLH